MMWLCGGKWWVVVVAHEHSHVTILHATPQLELNASTGVDGKRQRERNQTHSSDMMP